MSSNCYLITLVPRNNRKKKKKKDKKKKLKETEKHRKIKKKKLGHKRILLQGPRLLHSNYSQDKYWPLEIETTNKGIWHIK